jgi:hypothetical protein
VLNAGGDSCEIYGLSLNIFLKVYDPFQSSSTSDRHDDKRMSPKYYVSHDSEEALQMESISLDRNVQNDGGIAHYIKSMDSTDQLRSPIITQPLWTVCTVCLVSRVPYFEELSKCLEFAYHSTIVREVERWENERDQQCQKELFSGALNLKHFPLSSINPDMALDKHDSETEKAEANSEPEVGGDTVSDKVDRPVSSRYFSNVSQKTDSVVSSNLNFLPIDIAPFGHINPPHHSYHCYSFPFPSCRLLLDKLIAFLFLECPKPIARLLSVSLVLSSSAASSKEAEGEPDDRYQASGRKSSDMSASSQKISFVAQNPEFLPDPSNRLSFILRCFGPRVMLDILTCVLSESRMIFFSNDLNKLSLICEGFRVLIYPLAWTHVYLPIVPVQLLNLVEAPVPFLLGTHSENVCHINLHNLNEIILIDCDNGLIMENNNSVATQNMSTPVKLPEKEDRWLMLCLKEVHNILTMSNSSKGGSSSLLGYKWKEINNVDLIIQLLVFDVVYRLLRYIPDCLFYLSSSCPVFNRPLFIMEYTSEDYKKTLENLSITNAFHVLTENVYSNSRKFYLFCLRKLEEKENGDIALESVDSEEDNALPMASPVKSPLTGETTGSVSGSSVGAGAGADSAKSLEDNGESPSLTLSFLSSPGMTSIEANERSPVGLDGDKFINKVQADDASKSNFERPELVRSLSKGTGGAYKFTQPQSLLKKLSQNNLLNNVFDSPVGNASKDGSFSLSRDNSGRLSRSGSGIKKNFNILQSKPSFHRMENSPIFRKEVSRGSSGPLYISPFADLLPEWIMDDSSAPDGKTNDNSTAYILFLVEQRMKYFKSLICEYMKKYKSSFLNVPSGVINKADEEDSVVQSLSDDDFSSFFFSSTTFSSQVPYSLWFSTEITTCDALVKHEISAENEVCKGIGFNVINNSSSHEDMEINGEQRSSNETTGMTLPEQTETLNSEEKVLPPSIPKTVPDNHHVFSDGINSALSTPVSPAKTGLALMNPEKELLLFDTLLIAEAQSRSEGWTVPRLSDQFSFSQEQFVDDLKKCPYSLLYEEKKTRSFNGDSDNVVTVGPQNSVLTSKSNVVFFLFSSWSLFSFIDLANDSVAVVDSVVREFIQLIMTVKDINPATLIQSMHRCEVAFEKIVNRASFIQMLKNAKKDHSASSSTDQQQNVYPLNSTAFECIAKLFLKILTICNEQKDYLNAFRLLEIGGHYFQLISFPQDGVKSPEGDSAEEKAYELQTIEFLSERICQHPIYQLSTMWKGLLLDRLPLVSEEKKVIRENSKMPPPTSSGKPLSALSPIESVSSSHSGEDIVVKKRFSTDSDTELPNPAKKKYHINMIMAEIRSLLYMMLDLGVRTFILLIFLYLFRFFFV